jgi:HEAT repeat protein
MESEIKKLIEDMTGDNGIARQKAWHRLVKIGEPAIDYLIELQYSKNHKARWEAIKAIGQINDPETIPILINSLEDDKFDVRWLAAEGLIDLGKDVVKPLLNTFSQDIDSEYLREGVHHILKELERRDEFDDKTEIIPALEETNLNEKVIITVEKYLNNLK